MTVPMWRFISLGEITRQGRVLRISWPSVGSRRTRYTSKREITIPIQSYPTVWKAKTPCLKARHLLARAGDERHPPNRSEVWQWDGLRDGRLSLRVPLCLAGGTAPRALWVCGYHGNCR